MIYQNTQIENTQNQFSDAIRELKIGKFLRKSNVTKSCGITAYEVFQFLLLFVFQGKNLFRFLNSKQKDQAVSKNTYYRFLNETSYNWSRFLLLLAAKVTSAFDRLTRPERRKVLVLDDIDHRTNGYKVCKESMLKKTEAAVLLVKKACNAGIKADDILMDTWFTTEPNRWSMECFFKASKSFMKLGTEFQSRSYTAMVSHTAIVFTRYIVLEWIRRNEKDIKTHGELFFTLCEDIQDMDLTQALQSLMALFVEQTNTFGADITNVIQSKVAEWMNSQALFIQALFRNISWES